MTVQYFAQAAFSLIREHLQEEFSPDDLYQFGSQLIVGFPKEVCQVKSDGLQGSCDYRAIHISFLFFLPLIRD